MKHTPQKTVETWSTDAQAAYWRGFNEGCRMTFDFVGERAPEDVSFTCGPQHDFADRRAGDSGSEICSPQS
jgi:hypothetical protein